MRQHFVQNWNGVSLFLDTQATSLLELQLYTDASGSLGNGGFLAAEWFQGHWLPQHTQPKKEVLVLNGRSYFQIPGLYFVGSLLVREKGSLCGVTTCQWWPA